MVLAHERPERADGGDGDAAVEQVAEASPRDDAVDRQRRSSGGHDRRGDDGVRSSRERGRGDEGESAEPSGQKERATRCRRMERDRMRTGAQHGRGGQ